MTSVKRPWGSVQNLEKKFANLPLSIPHASIPRNAQFLLIALQWDPAKKGCAQQAKVDKDEGVSLCCSLSSMQVLPELVVITLGQINEMLQGFLIQSRQIHQLADIEPAFSKFCL